MIKSIIFAVCAVALGIIISPLLALAVGLTMGFIAFVDFWIGLIGSIRTKENKEIPKETQEETVWERHSRVRQLYNETIVNPDTKKTDEYIGRSK